MRITESRLRKIIRSVIKENYTEDGFKMYVSKPDLDMINSLEPHVKAKAEYYLDNRAMWNLHRNDFVRMAERDDPTYNSIRMKHYKNWSDKDFKDLVFALDGRGTFAFD